MGATTPLLPNTRGRDHNKNNSAELAASEQQQNKLKSIATIRKPLASSSTSSPQLIPYAPWLWRLLKRKQTMVLCALMMFLLFLVSVMQIDNLMSGFEAISFTGGGNSLDEDDELSATAAGERIALMHRSHIPGMKGYLVWSDQCQMPNTDPYEPEVMKFFKRQRFKPCSTLPPLTSVTWDAVQEIFILHLHDERIRAYEKLMRKQYWISANRNMKEYHCCYQSVERNGTGAHADFVIRLNDCQRFESGITHLSPELDSILVHCYVGKSSGNKPSNKEKAFYSNGHPLLPMRPDLKRRINMWKSRRADKGKDKESRTSDPISVLLLGIDSISRVNLIRAMPRTAQYLFDNEWFELSGYNKIDDNTFPNLMAVLVGLNKTSSHLICPPAKPYAFDNCNFVWKEFRENGYATAYAEDAVSINTFNYLKTGFEEAPVDYYLRPFLLAAERHLPTTHHSHMIDCIGPKHSAEAVYDYALQVAERHKDEPFFGLFWTNSLSHNAISDCSMLDTRMVDYLKSLSSMGVLNRTLVVFFSDHGLRFGPTRRLHSSHFEERLPFLFFWLPPRLRQTNPEFVNALITNKNRLTNPYDLHLTLRHIASLSRPSKTKPERSKPLPDCPLCQSLFTQVPQNRSCTDIAIEDHWCTCMPYQNVYKNSKTVKHVAKLTVSYLNDFVAEYNNGSLRKLCVPLKLGSIEHAFKADHSQGKVNTITSSPVESAESTYRITFYTKPNQGLFEATVRYNAQTDKLQVTGEVSRLNSYSSDAACTADGAAKKYCSCVKII